MSPCAGRGGRPGQSEVHISYHNGDHYNSVRRIGDCGPGGPSRLRLCLGSDCDSGQSPLSPDSGQESDYENSPSHSNLDRLGEEIETASSPSGL